MTPIRSLIEAVNAVGPHDITHADAMALWALREQAEDMMKLCDDELLRRTKLNIEVVER